MLDEPTNGLDPQGTREVRKLVRELAADGTTVLVSSHLLGEIEQVATHVGMMAAGRLLRQGPLDEVLADGAPRVRVSTPDLDGPGGARAARAAPGSIRDRARARRVRARRARPPRTSLAHSSQAGVRLRGLTVDRPDLEDLFVSITGEGFDVLN